MTEQTPPPAGHDPAQQAAYAAQQHAAAQQQHAAAQQQAYAQQQQQAGYQSQPGYTGQYQQYQASAVAGPNLFERIGISVAAFSLGAGGLLLLFISQLLGAGEGFSFSVGVLDTTIVIIVLTALALFTDVQTVLFRAVGLGISVLAIGYVIAKLLDYSGSGVAFAIAIVLYIVGIGLIVTSGLLPKSTPSAPATQNQASQAQQNWQQSQ